MPHEVIVVGAGIGGLTTAALLAARGIDVCLLERQSQVGGCVANFEHLGYTFEPTFGLYSGWEGGGTWDRIFANLPVSAPAVTKLSPSYVVRMPDGSDIEITDSSEVFESNLAAAFPNCAETAIRFVRTMREAGDGPADDVGATEKLLADTSETFRLFINAQLQAFAQCTSAQCSLSRAAAALKMATGKLCSIQGGGQALADRLADSLKSSGGSLRLDSPVLRLAYDTAGRPIGVDLLSGERVNATRAIVSNLTMWDTYGKLIGLSRTPPSVSKEMRSMSAWGAYLIFLSVAEELAAQIPKRTLAVYNSAASSHYDQTNQQLMLNLTSESACAPAGKRALTAWAFTDAEDWFSFHEDSTAHEERDQSELEKWWARLHSAMPELGGNVEVIETATPQTFYEATRRKFGMMGAPAPTLNSSAQTLPFSNLFLVSDTASETGGLEGVARHALQAVAAISKRG